MLNRDEVWDFFISLLLVILIVVCTYKPVRSETVAPVVDEPVPTPIETSVEPLVNIPVDLSVAYRQHHIYPVVSRGGFNRLQYPTPTPMPMAEPKEEPVANNSKKEKLLGSDFLLTHYDACVQCCGKADGITKSGRHVEENVTVAVDTRYIKLGSKLRIEIPDGSGGYKVYRANARADDIGGAINKHKIDVYVPSHSYAYKCGKIRNARVYLLED